MKHMFMRILAVLIGMAVMVASTAHEDDDFDEFDFEFTDDDQDFEDIEEDEDDFEDIEVVEEEGDDFDDIELDSDEFEDAVPPDKLPLDEIKIAESAIRMKPFWQEYIIEILIVAGMVLYITNYLIGRNRNSTIAYSWLESHMDLLKANFSLVGDTGENEDTDEEGQLVRESDSIFTLWASGRQNCNGMLVQIKLQKRHDLLSLFLAFFRPQPDTVTVVIQVNDEDMDHIIFALGQKKVLQRMQKEYEDLNNYCTAVRPGSKQGLESSYHILSEISEAVSSYLLPHVVSFLNKHSAIIESLHISDQYTGFTQDSEDPDVVTVRKSQKRIQLTYTMPGKTEGLTSVMKFALLTLDQIKGIRLSREAREKSSKNRAKVAQNIDKLQHAQRQEAAQQRKEDKRRAEKEKILQETDPDKIRKLEEREHKKELKRMQPRMKQMKVRMG